MVVINLPGPTGKELSYASVYIEKNFNRLHIRPSGVGMCLKAQVLTILHALYPDALEFMPCRPDGKDGLATAAAFGNAYEEWRYTQAWLSICSSKLYGGMNQFDLVHPILVNVDGTPVTSHPDIALEMEERIVLDEEIKTTGETSRDYLPKLSHLEQRLLRQYFWRGLGFEPYGRIHYGFRGSFTDPRNPVDFELVPHERGMLGLWNEEIYTWEYIEELNQRLLYIKDCVDRQIIPERHQIADTPHYYECHFISPLFQAECPWRESCWRDELAYERRPAIIVTDMDAVIREFVELKNKKAETDKESREYHKRIKELQEKLDPFFEEFGSRVAAGNIIVERTLVKVPERHRDGYEFYRYDIK